jgi:DNA-binding LacI/PurR family transcriptional regulator
MIAEESGVSQATVSRALRSDPRISEAVRLRVQTIAARLGYRPDPTMSKLMAHMRSLQQTRFQSLLGFILPEEDFLNDYSREMVQGARERATTLGYAVDDFRTSLAPRQIPALNRILKARGVEGIIIFPRNHLEPPPLKLDLTNLAAVACASFDGVFPAHQVGSGHVQNIELVFSKLEKSKWKRPGLVTWEDFDRRQRWAPRMAYYHFYHDVLGEIPPPLFDWHKNGNGDEKLFLKWFRKVEPDVLLVVGPIIAAAARNILRRNGIRRKLPMIGIGHTEAGISGVDEKPSTIGSAAVDVLTSHILRSEKGWPKDVKIMTLTGELR